MAPARRLSVPEITFLTPSSLRQPCRLTGTTTTIKVSGPVTRQGGTHLKGSSPSFLTCNSQEKEAGTKTEYRVWNPFRSKIASAIVGGIGNIYMKPGSKVLYLGGASGTTVSHVADLVGPEGCVYAVEFSKRSGRDLVNMAKKRTNVIPIIEDARHPQKHRMRMPMVDVIFADVAQPDQARILGLNAAMFVQKRVPCVKVGRA